MNFHECPQESSVLAALANDSLSEELAAHLSSCAICQDAKLVWSYLQDSARAEAQMDIAPAGIVWWKAQLARKRVEARRSVVFIETMQKISFAAVVILFVAIGAWQVPKLFEASRLLLAGSAAVLILFVASVIVLFGFARHSDSSMRTRRIPFIRPS